MNENKTLSQVLEQFMLAKGFALSADIPRIDLCTVKSIDTSNLTCVVQSERDKGEYTAFISIDEQKENVKIFPKIGSKCSVLFLQGDSFILGYEQIEKMEFGDGSNVMGVIKIKEQQDEINNKLTKKLNDLITFVNTFYNEFKLHVHPTGSPGAPTSPVTPPPSGTPPTSAQNIDKANYEHLKIINIKY